MNTEYPNANKWNRIYLQYTLVVQIGIIVMMAVAKMLGLVTHVLVRVALAVFFCFLFVAFSIMVLILTPYRMLVWAMAKFLRPDLKDFVKGPTNVLFSWWNQDRCSTNVTCFFIIEGKVTADETRKVVQSRLLSLKAKDGSGLYDKLKQTFVDFMGYRFLKWDEGFDIGNHIRLYGSQGELELPSPCNENDLRQVIGRLAGRPWKKDCSPWEVLIINNYHHVESTEPCSVFILRMSHAIADGYSLKRCFLIATQTEIPEFDFSRFEPPLWKKILMMAFFPVRMFYDIADQQVENSTHGGSEWRLKKKDAEYEFNFAFTRPFPVELIKAIKNRYKVSYNAVLFAAVGAGIRRLVEETGQNVPESMACILPVPKPRHPGGLTNHVFAGRMPLKLASTENIEQALKVVDQDLVRAVKAIVNPALEICLSLNSLLPTCMAKILYKIDNANVIISNFPVITVPIHFNGKKVVGLIPSVVTMNPCTPFGATVSMGGVNGLQIITINVDKSIFPDEATFFKVGRYVEQAIVKMCDGVEDNDNSEDKQMLENSELRRRVNYSFA